MNRIFLVCLVSAINWIPGFTSVAAGQSSDIVVRTSVDPEDGALVGQKIILTVDVLAKDSWASLSRIPQIEIPGAIVYLPDNQSLRLNESIGEDSYAGQRYEWWVYPRREGSISIGEIEIEVNQKIFGANPDPAVTLKSTESITLQVAYPEGVQSANDLVCAENLEVTEEWKPSKTKHLMVGDGVTRTITRTIDGAPGMLLPIIQPERLDGVRAYPKQPSVTDTSNRGDLVGKRVDAATYVFESGGSFTFPATKLDWWNEESNQLETTKLPERSFEVIPAVASASAATTQQPPQEIHFAWIWLAAAMLLTVVGYFLRDWMKNKYSELIALTFFEERRAFSALLAAARSQNSSDTVGQLYHWMNFPLHDQEAPQIEVLLDRFGAKTDATQIRKLVLAESNTDWDTINFISACKQIRKNWRRGSSRVNTRSSALPELN